MGKGDGVSNKLNKLVDSLVTRKKTELPSNILRPNNISVLTLDERWNTLFKNIEKTSIIVRCEEKINGYLIERAKLTSEQKECSVQKKEILKRIMEISAEAFDQNSDEALERMDSYRSQVEGINARLSEIEERFSGIEKEIADANMEMLENAVSYLYYNIRKAQKRVEELDGLIEETRKKLMECISERYTISEAYNEAYTSFHDLLGAEQVSELDRLFGIE